MVLGFDPRNSDLVLRVAWPLFVLNSINAFVEEDTGYVSSFRTGDVWRIPAPSSVDPMGIPTRPTGAPADIPVGDDADAELPPSPAGSKRCSQLGRARGPIHRSNSAASS